MAVLKLVANFSLWKRDKSTLGVFSSQPNLLTYSQTMEFGSVLVGNFAKLMKHFGKVDLANRKYYHGKTAKSEKST